MSWGSYKLIERPGRVYLRRLLGRLAAQQTAIPVVEVADVLR
jgi:hypothetical protein